MSRSVFFEKFKQRWQPLATKVNNMSLRDRFILLIVSLLVIYFGWWLLLRMPLESKAKNLMTQFQMTGNQLNMLQVQAERISAKITQPTLSKEHKQVQTLEEQVTLLGNELKTFEGKVIPYEKLADMLREVIMQEKDLKLTSIQSPVSKVLFEGPSQKLYEHSIELTFQTESYFAALKYLKRLEGSHWQIFWDRLNYQVDKYPIATVTIKVHSLGYEYRQGATHE